MSGCVCEGDAKLEAKAAHGLSTVTVIMRGQSSLEEEDRVSVCLAIVENAPVCVHVCMHVCVLLVKMPENMKKISTLFCIIMTSAI